MARAFVVASSQYVNRSANLFTAPPATVALWFNPTAVNIQQHLFDIGSTTAGQFFEIRVNNTADQIVSQFDGTTSGNARFDASATAGAWQHIAGVWASSTSRSIYTQGVLRHTETSSVNNPASINTTSFASKLRSGTRGDYFGGSVAEAAAWSVALDAAEIAALAKGVSPLLIRPQSLLGYWPFLNSAAPDIDRWNAGFNLTPTNTPTMADHIAVFYPAVNDLIEVGAAAFTLLAEFGTYTLSGTAASLLAARKILAVTGSYALTGVATTLVHGYILIAATGSYVLTGLAATLSSINMAFRRLIATFITSIRLKGTKGG